MYDQFHFRYYICEQNAVEVLCQQSVVEVFHQAIVFSVILTVTFPAFRAKLSKFSSSA